MMRGKNVRASVSHVPSSVGVNEKRDGSVQLRTTGFLTRSVTPFDIIPTAELWGANFASCSRVTAPDGPFDNVPTAELWGTSVWHLLETGVN